MKYFFLVSSLSAGGAERVATTLCNAWADRGENVYLIPTFSEGGKCFYELSTNLNVIYLADLVKSKKSSFWNRIARLKMLRKLIFNEQPDVIISFLSDVNVAAILASIGFGRPVIICERTEPFISPLPFLVRIARRITYPFASALVVQTKMLADKIANSNWGVKKIQVISNPIPSQMLITQLNTKKLNGNKVLLAVGRFVEEKQFSKLIKVFSTISINNNSWVLRIVGDGPLENKLQQDIINYKLEGRVELPGNTTNIALEYANADVFVMTSKFEGFPNALLEAMAIGLPSVSLDCANGPKEITLDGTVGILVPLNNDVALKEALEKVMLSEELRLTLGLKGRESVISRFSLDKVLIQWDFLFKEVALKN